MLKFLVVKYRRHLQDDSTVLTETLNTDLIWALLCIQLPCLMQSGISPHNMQQVPGRGRDRSILKTAVLQYCPKIEDSSTNFTTVCTV